MTRQNTPRHPAIYARISDDPQGYAVGVRDQATQGSDFITRTWPGTEPYGPGCRCKECQRFGVPADVYCDNDITASGKKKRPHYERLLADIQAGRVDAVVVTHTDRLHRHLMELERYIDVCQPGGVPTYAIKGTDIDLTSSMGRGQARMAAVFARIEWERMVERQQNAKRRNRDAGIRTGGTAPFGYRLDARQDRRQIPGVSKGLVVYEPEASAVRQAYAGVASGVSLYAIAMRWNQAGLRTARARVNGGLPWKGKSVKIVLLHAANAGLIEYPQGSGNITGEAMWDPIVDESTWRGVRAILTDPSRTRPPGVKPSILLTGVLICGVCDGRRFGTQRQRSNGRRAYRCMGAADAPGLGGTGHLTRDLATVDAYVELHILDLLSREDVLTALRTQPDIDVPALDARRTAINAELEDWARAPGITPRQLQIRNEPLLAELRDIDDKLASALHGDPLPEFAGEDDPAVVWIGLPIERKRAVAAMLLRVRLQPIGRGGGRKAAGWRPGDPWQLDTTAVEILPPDA